MLGVASHREYKNAFAEDTDGSPLATQQLMQVMNHEQTTQELRFGVAAGERVDLTFGAAVFYALAPVHGGSARRRQWSWP